MITSRSNVNSVDSAIVVEIATCEIIVFVKKPGNFSPDRAYPFTGVPVTRFVLLPKGGTATISDCQIATRMPRQER